MRPCDAPGCEAYARFAPAIRVWPKGTLIFSDDDSVLIKLDMGFCQEHARQVGAEDIISDEEWLDICDGLLEIGKVIPSKENARIEIESLDSPDRQEFFH